MSRGFTLIELSVVLVIIGLLVAGIVSGASMVHQAKLKNIVSDVGKFQVAVNEFSMQYNALPGDFNGATRYWTSCVDDVPNTNTCNGDGNRKIEYANSASSPERLRAWQHLDLAGIIDGPYPGVDTVGGGQQSNVKDIGRNVPGSSVDGVGFDFYNTASLGNTLLLGKFRANNTLMNSAVTAQDAKSIDSKIDDGIRDTGKVSGAIGFDAGGPFCSDASTPSKYKVADDTVACIMYFQLMI